MRIFTITLAIMVLFLSGCATTGAKGGGDVQIQQLKEQIQSLEAQLQKKDEEISVLDNELKIAQDKDAGVTAKDLEEEKANVGKLSVRQIQKALKKAGFYQGAIDGKMGPKTRKAIKKFQKQNDLVPDGLVGNKTSEKLGGYLEG